MTRTGNAPSTSEDKDKKSVWWQPALMMFLRMSAYVVVPVIIALFVGKSIDRKLDSAPFGLLSVVGIAFTVSMYGLVKEASREYRKLFESQDDNKEEEKDKINENATRSDNPST